MGATNTTANYSLSQFIGTDKPAWLQDYNGDMLKIDTGINAAKVAADGAQNTADAAQNDATTANNAITNTINPAISSLNTTVGNQGGAINTINSLIGNGTPTTTDQTIIGAINEINANVNSGNVLNWTYVDSGSGAHVVDLPASFHEIAVKIDDPGTTVSWEFIIPYNHLGSTARVFVNGAYTDSSYHNSVSISVSKTQCAINGINMNGTPVTNGIITVHSR